MGVVRPLPKRGGTGEPSCCSSFCSRSSSVSRAAPLSLRRYGAAMEGIGVRASDDSATASSERRDGAGASMSLDGTAVAPSSTAPLTASAARAAAGGGRVGALTSFMRVLPGVRSCIDVQAEVCGNFITHERFRVTPVSRWLAHLLPKRGGTKRESLGVGALRCHSSLKERSARSFPSCSEGCPRRRPARPARLANRRLRRWSTSASRYIGRPSSAGLRATSARSTRKSGRCRASRTASWWRMTTATCASTSCGGTATSSDHSPTRRTRRLLPRWRTRWPQPAPKPLPLQRRRAQQQHQRGGGDDDVSRRDGGANCGLVSNHLDIDRTAQRGRGVDRAARQQRQR